MRGNSFGNLLVLTAFGESHGPAMGAVIDGCPAGIDIDSSAFEYALARRRPGQSKITSARAERDFPEILSGIHEGKTLGTPIAVLVRNNDAKSSDYSRETYRVGHADEIWERKYGIRDHRGGGRASGRETLARVIGGVIAEHILPEHTSIVGYSARIGSFSPQSVPETLTRDVVDGFMTRCPDAEADKEITLALERMSEEGESVGGIIELRIDNPPAGLGEPVFRKLKSELVAAIMSIGAVSGVSLGDAFNDVVQPGSSFHSQVDGAPNGTNAGSHGIQGGISTGQRITLQIAVKPSSTIGAMAREGRHDPCIVPRVIPVVESMAALVMADLWLATRLDRI